VEPAVARLDISEELDFFHAAQFSHLEGHVQDRAPIELYEVIEESGACRYLKPALSNCDPVCAPGEMCTPEQQCEHLPESLSAGQLSIQGLSERLEISPRAYDAGTYLGPVTLPPDLFEEGDAIGARFEGDDFPEVVLGARGVDAIGADLVDAGLEISDGANAEISWDAGADPEACVRVVLNGSNVTHGAPLRDVIWCESEDTGSLTVPQALVESFPKGETPELTEGFDWPLSQLVRFTRSRVATDQGTAELVVRSTTHFRLRHP
jgi:hypothetical protein